MIRFRFAPAKARAAVQWMLHEARPDPLDLHTILKACYFADKEHLNRWGRPIFGARYRAMRYGPVPVEIYEMLKGEPYWLAELAAERYPWSLNGYRVKGENEPPDLDALSETDFEELERGFDRARRMTFDQRTAATHGPDWQKAQLGWMRYEDMIEPDNPRRAEILETLEEISFRMVL
ncbi:MAG: Panacea domain-containing protein [Geminicoccaceae bacterium]|nr:Panacea domain-containing protein [Geminicoccaceae bacterium]MDW8371990.1 Panacea domain-containing protein [Geminicoccaceae bacterium]